MTLLLDTHVVLWWQRDDRRLGRAAREAIATADVVWVSAVSGWDVAIKCALGRLRLDEPFPILIAADDFTELGLAHRTCRQRHDALSSGSTACPSSFT